MALDEGSANWGRVRTPKLGWIDVSVTAPFVDAFGLPVALQTDVGGAAVGEGRWGAARGLEHYAYVTAGTGIGAGIVSGGRLVRGVSHPEAGHIRIERPAGDTFAGVCPWHGDCLEGLFGGAALAARWGAPAETFGEDHPAWAMAGDGLAQLMLALALTTAPQRIVLGGGVERGRRCWRRRGSGSGPISAAMCSRCRRPRSWSSRRRWAAFRRAGRDGPGAGEVASRLRGTGFPVSFSR